MSVSLQQIFRRKHHVNQARPLPELYRDVHNPYLFFLTQASVVVAILAIVAAGIIMYMCLDPFK